MAAMASGAFAADPPGQSPPPYRLGPEDTISVVVGNHTEFSGDFFVPQDGMVDLPAVGRMKVAGQTPGELANSITEALRKRLLDPEVTVTLKLPRMQRVYVLGAVAKPGFYDMKPGWRVTEALAAAGGLAPEIEPAECKASILRTTTGERQTVNLTEVIQGSPDANALVESGDVVTIEAEERLPIYVMGKVRSPGLYKLRKESAGVMEALTLAGGVLEDSSLSRVTVTHINGKTEVSDLTSAVMKGEQGSTLKLQAGDLVVVPESNARIAVLGYVNQPGFFPLRDGQKMMLSDALGLAKGVDNKQAETASVVIIRVANGKQEKLMFDLRRFFKKGDPSQNPEMMAGDVIYVPKTRKPDWGIVYGAISAVSWIINPFLK